MTSSRGRIPPVSMAVLMPTRAAAPKPTKMALPVEILEQIVDYMPVSTQLTFARTNHAMRDMVYDDSRWVSKLKAMGVWNEEEARRAAEEELQRRREEEEKRREEVVLGRPLTNGTTTLFDAALEKQKFDAMPVTPIKNTGDLMDFAIDSPEAFGDFQGVSPAESPVMKPLETSSPLTVLSSVVSHRGKARQEFAKVYEVLAPIYLELVHSNSLEDAPTFKHRPKREEQAKLLHELVRFGRSNSVDNWTRCQKRLAWILETFERQCITEFEEGYDSQDVDGKMKRYAHILYDLNGGLSCIQSFIRKHPSIFIQRDNPMLPLGLNLNPMQEYVDRLMGQLDGQTLIADRVFPSPARAMLAFTKQVLSTVVMDYATSLIDKTRQGSETDVYLKTVVGTYHQCQRLILYLNKPKDATKEFQNELAVYLDALYEPHIESYLRVESDYYRKCCDSVVDSWKKKIQNEANDFESALRGHVIRENDKTNFLASFKKVILLPVSVLPTLPFPGTHSRSSTHLGKVSTPAQSVTPARPSTPSWEDSTPSSPPLPSAPLPTTELATQTAILNSRLERIKTLFSIEVALQLAHMGKEVLERMKTFRHLRGDIGIKVHQSCESVFVTLLVVLGQGHIQPGFEQALEHLSEYRPSDNPEDSENAGALLTFLELVHIGDLIQQMVEVFFNQEIAGMIDRTDFLNPVVKEKKNFEQKTIDAYVAAGLNKGIDVLIQHVEYLLATKQLPSDYCPPPAAVTGYRNADLDPSATATAVVTYLKIHTKLLQGSTDKSILDVFFQEIGLRLFSAITKHVKTMKVSSEGAIKLIADFNLYHQYASSLRQLKLMPYYAALKEVGHLFIIEEGQGKAVASIVSDVIRFEGIFRPEEIHEFVQCRADWFKIKRDVEKAVFGLGREDCVIM